MQCPHCSTEVPSGEIACPSCGAFRISGASPLGVILSWVGITVGVCVSCLWSAVLVLPFIGINMAGFPWLVLAIGTVIAVGLLWYSRSTRQPRWIQRQ
ncbi:MAG: hypothetical protein HY306_13600 [Nitrosomonadales bacterium]|nr:hypothetical protein [Nitrosomonadales bacterium]